MSNSPIMIRKFNPLHCGESGLFIPLALGQVFLNCPPPTHLQLTYNRFRGKITRCEVYKSDLLTVRGVQIRPSHVFTFYTHAYTRRGSSCPSGRLRRFSSSILCFRVVSRHLRSSEGGLLEASQVLIHGAALPNDQSSRLATRRRDPL